jgi:hypothetical protein
MSTTDEYWEIDGTSLHLPAWNVTSLEGRLRTPPLRGEDAKYAYVAGEEFRPKIPASNVISLAMWMVGADPDSGSLTTDQRLQFNENLKVLFGLLWNPKRQFVLTRRRLLIDLEAEEPEPVIQVTTALGQLASPLDARMTGRTRTTFTVEIKLCDPFFYGEEIETTIDLDETVTIHNPGDYNAADRGGLSVELVGELENPRLTNATPDPDVWVQYNAVISDGEDLTLDVEQFTAVASAPEISIPEISLNRVGYITHSGARQWMGLLKGDNELTLTADSGTGHAIVRFRPPYL